MNWHVISFSTCLKERLMLWHKNTFPESHIPCNISLSVKYNGLKKFARIKFRLSSHETLTGQLDLS